MTAPLHLSWSIGDVATEPMPVAIVEALEPLMSMAEFLALDPIGRLDALNGMRRRGLVEHVTQYGDAMVRDIRVRHIGEDAADRIDRDIASGAYRTARASRPVTRDDARLCVAFDRVLNPGSVSDLEGEAWG